MTKRQVLEPLVSYREEGTGLWKHALKGEQVDVATDDISRFDALNFINSSTPPRKRGPATQEPSPTSKRSTKKAAAKAAGRQPTPKKKT